LPTGHPPRGNKFAPPKIFSPALFSSLKNALFEVHPLVGKHASETIYISAFEDIGER
jgi:hypothetical protein